MRKTTTVAVLLAAGLWATAGLAQGPPPGPPHGMHGTRGRPFMNDGAQRAIGALLHAESLTDEQRERMHAVLEADRATVEPILDQLRTANEGLADRLLASDTPPQEALDQLTERIADLRGQLLQRQVQTVLALRDVLTPGQLDGLAAQDPLAADADVVFQRR